MDDTVRVYWQQSIEADIRELMSAAPFLGQPDKIRGICDELRRRRLGEPPTGPAAESAEVVAAANQIVGTLDAARLVDIMGADAHMELLEFACDVLSAAAEVTEI